MPEVDKAEFEKARQEMERKKHKSKVLLGKKMFEFYELEPKSCPETHLLVFSMACQADYLIGISRSVPEHFRPYWAFHEYVKNSEFGRLNCNRILAAFDLEISLVPEEWKPSYLPPRKDYFTGLVEHCSRFPEAYSPEEAIEFDRIKEKLEMLVQRHQ